MTIPRRLASCFTSETSVGGRGRMIGKVSRGTESSRLWVRPLPGAFRPALIEMVELAQTGLGAAYSAREQTFAQTLRGTADGTIVKQGTNLRYAAIAGLGLSRL